MGWIGRGLGDFGSQVGQGYDINLGWRERLQNMALANARQKLADIMGPLQLQLLQDQVKKLGQVQPAGIEKLPTGAISGVTFDPNTGTYSLQNLAPGTPPEPKFPTLQAAAAYYLEKGDWDKLRQVNEEIGKTKPPAKEEKPDTQIFGGYRWQYDPEKKIQGLRDQTGQYVRLGIAKEPGTGSEENTPFKLWHDQNPKGTYQQWLDQSRQVDRNDAVNSVKAAMNAQKSLQALELNIQKSNKTFSIWNPRTYGNDPALSALSQQALDNYNSMRQDAVTKLTEAGMPIPTWLTQSPGNSGDLSDLGGQKVGQ